MEASHIAAWKRQALKIIWVPKTKTNNDCFEDIFWVLSPRIRSPETSTSEHQIPYPQSLTWNLNMVLSNRNLLFQGLIFKWTMLNFRGVWSWNVSFWGAYGWFLNLWLSTAPRQWWRNPGHPQGRCPLRHQWHGWWVQSKAWNLFNIPKKGESVSIIKA